MRLTENTFNKTRYEYILKKVTGVLHQRIEKLRSEISSSIVFISCGKDRERYSFILLLRFIYLYFLQKKSYLAGDFKFLENAFLKKPKTMVSFYRGFLKALFFGETKDAGFKDVKFFEKHDIELKNPDIDIDDSAFEKLFMLFSQYEWDFEMKRIRSESHINFEVIACIFEKYTDQKTIGAYYTGKDVGNYIAVNTVIPALISKIEKSGDASGGGLLKDMLGLLSASPERYMSDYALKGVGEDYPRRFAPLCGSMFHRGVMSHDVPARFGVCGETLGDSLFRHKNSRRVIAAALERKFNSLDSLLCENIDVSTLFIDALENLECEKRIKCVFKALFNFKILDPAVGSGAFLIAAIDVLTPVYSALKRAFERSGVSLPASISGEYVMLKAIIENNIFGIDISSDSIEIIKLIFSAKLFFSAKNIDLAGEIAGLSYNVAAANFLTQDAFEGLTFDALLCNPPYVALSKYPHDVGRWRNAHTRDVFNCFVLKSASFAESGCRYGFIVPLSITYDDNCAGLLAGFGPRRSHMIASFDNIPSPLFAKVSQRFSIWLGGPDDDGPVYYSTPLYRWRSKFRPFIMKKIRYTPLANYEVKKYALARIENNLQLEIINRIHRFDSGIHVTARKHHGSDVFRLGYCHVARNFVSVYLNDPPYLDAVSLLPSKPLRVGYIKIRGGDYANAVYAALCSDLFFFYWLSRSDGFNVSNWTIGDFIKCLSGFENSQIGALAQIGRLMDKRRFEALVFKKNAGKFVGNFNYRRHLPELSRRADLLLFMGLGLGISHYASVFDCIQRTLAQNVNSKNEENPEMKMSGLFESPDYDRAYENELFKTIDKMAKSYFGFSETELAQITRKFRAM